MHAASKIAVSAFLTWILVIPAFAYAKPDLQRSVLPHSTIDYGATVNVSTTTTGSTITVNWTAPDGHAANDFLRLARATSQDNEYHWTQTLGAATSGSFVVNVPNEINRYEFRLFRGSDNTRVTQSQPFVANKAGYSVSPNTLLIAAGGQISVTWESPAGRPINDRVAINSLNNSTIVAQQYIGSANPPSLTFDAPLDAGQYDVRYYETDSPNAVAWSQIITITTAEGWFAGRIRNGDTGQYINAALVEVLQQGVVKGSSLTNSNGGYNIPVSAAGTYDLRVTASGFSAVTRSSLVLSAGNTRDVDIDLTNTGNLSGSVTRSGSGTAIAAASIQLKQGTSIIASTNTDLAGNYNFAKVSPGTYSVEAHATGFSSQTQVNLAITAGGALIANLVLTAGQQGSGNSLEYLYDDSGRLVGTKEQGLLTKLYNYDLTGNLISISSPPSNAPAFISFSPQIGLPGTQVIIRGVNFDQTVGQNSVGFSGVSAIISSASATELVATVPASATTGPITVSSTGGTATSSTAFTIGTASAIQPPVVSGFSPAIGHPGDVVTIIGSNFESEIGDNDVRFGSTGTPVSSGTTSTLNVPASTSSGKVSVTTPYGTGTSAYEFVSVPSTVDLSRVDFKGRTWFGNAKYVSISNNREGVLTFDAIAGKRMSLVLTALSTNSRVDIYRPDGKLLSTSSFSTVAPDYWFVDTQTLPLTGTYTVVIIPNGGAGASLRMTIYDVPPDISGELPLNSYKSVSFGTPGQNGNLTFSAQAGQKILLNVQDHTFGGTIRVQRFLSGNSPDSPFILGSPFVNQGYGPIFATFTPDGVTIPATGTYNIALDPTRASIGSMTVSLFIVPPDPVATMNIGSSETVSTSSKGQNVWIDFDGIAGQRISLRVREVTYPNGFAMSLNKPDGSFFVTPSQAGNDTFIDTRTLPVNGRYKIYLNPPGYDIGNATIDLFDVPADVVATTSINGSPVTVSAAVPGHNPTVTFDALQGQQARVNISAATVVNGTQVLLKGPDGAVVSSTSINSGTGLISSVTLPVAGTYKVEVDPSGINLGGATLSIGGDAYGSVIPGGASSTATVSTPGQSSWLTFSGTAGQRISVKLTDVTIASGSVSIRKADGGYLGAVLQIGSNNNFIDTVVLPTTGQYSVLVDPSGDSTGAATVNIYNVPADAAGSIVIGSPQTKTTTVPGQNLSLTFAGTANQRISLEMMSVSISAGTIIIKRPDGSSQAAAGFGTSGAGLYDVVLPIAGDYQIYIDPQYDNTGSATVQLFGTGTGNPNPTVQLGQSVSVQKGFASNGQTQASTSVSVMKGSTFGTSTGSSLFSSVSVMKGSIFGETTTLQASNSVSVTTGPVVVSASPVQISKNTTIVLTITGINLGTVSAVRLVGSDQNNDNTIIVTNISVNTEGTVLTATVQTATTTAIGERWIVLSSPSHGLSQTAGLAANLISIVQ